MFLFDVGQEVTVGKVTYQIKAVFKLEDQNWYTVMDEEFNTLDNRIESSLFKSKSAYEKAKMSKQIALLEAHNVQLANDLYYYKNAYYSIFNNRHRW